MLFGTELDWVTQSDSFECYAVYDLQASRDKKQLKQIYEHFGTTVDEATFTKVYEYAVSQPHGFLYIDTEPKKEYMRFRVGFNEFIKI